MGVPGGGSRGSQHEPARGDRGESTPASRLVSYLLVSGGGAALGFAMSLCSIGNSARYATSAHSSDSAHLLIILGSTLAGGLLGFVGVWRILRKRRG